MVKEVLFGEGTINAQKLKKTKALSRFLKSFLAAIIRDSEKGYSISCTLNFTAKNH